MRDIIFSLLKRASLPFLFRAIGALLTYASAVLVVNFYGVEGSGDFFTILALWVLMFGIGKFGIDTLSLKYVAASDRDDRDFVARFFFYLSLRRQIYFLIILILTGIFLYLYSGGNDSSVMKVWWTVVFTSPLTALIFILAACLQGKGYISLAAISNGIMIALFFVLLILFFSPEVSYGMLYFAANFLALVFVLLIFHRVIGLHKNKLDWADAPGDEINRSSVKLTVNTFLTLMNVWLGQIVVSTYYTDYDKTLFGAGDRTSKLFMIFLIAINAVIAPKIARMWSLGEFRELSSLIRGVVVTLFLLGITLFIIVFFASPYIIQLFKVTDPAGESVLLILCAGQLVNLMTGPCVFMLTLTGAERTLVHAQAAVLILFAAMLAIYISSGVVAIAIIQASSIAVFNISCLVLGFRMLNSRIAEDCR